MKAAISILLGVYSLAVGVLAQWTLISQENPPGQRFGSASMYCTEKDSMILFSGFRYIQDLQDRYMSLDDLWAYSFTHRQWSSISQTTKPIGRIWASLTHIPTNVSGTCTAVLVGGALKSGGGDSSTESFVTNAEVWLLNISGESANWTRLSPKNVGPGYRSMHQAVFRRGSLILMGGHRFANPTNLAFDDMWELDLTNLTSQGAAGNYTWNQIAPGFSGQSWVRPRFSHAMAVHIGPNSSDDRLVVFGGTSYINVRDMEVLSDVCVYQFSTNQWYIPSGVKLERTAHGAIMTNGRFWAFGGNTRVRISTNAYRTYVFDDLLMTDLTQGDSIQSAPACSSPDGKTGLWCTAFPHKDQVRPLVRFNHATVQRGNSLVIYGGTFKEVLGDFWMVDTNSALPSLVVSEEDVLEGGADLASTVYFMIAILSMMVVCFLVFVVSLRRHRSAHPVFIIGLAGGAGNHPRVVGARQSVIDALPTRTYRKAQAVTPGVTVIHPQAIVDPSTSTEATTTTPVATTVHGHDDELHGLCAICLTDYDDGETIRVLPCQHFFHPACVDQWLISHNACPMCKAVVDPEPEHDPAQETSVQPDQRAAPEVAQVVELEPTSPTNRDGQGRPTAAV